MPLGVPAPGATTETAAVKVTDCPTTDDIVDADSDVVVAAWFTIWLRLPELEAKFPSPL